MLCYSSKHHDLSWFTMTFSEPLPFYGIQKSTMVYDGIRVSRDHARPRYNMFITELLAFLTTYDAFA